MTHSRSSSDDERPPHEVVLAETNWASLQTGFGSGEDLPEVLMRLLEPDPKVQVTALSQLGEWVNHQNSIYEATAPAAVFVAGILTHPAAMTLRPFRNAPMRATLLSWLWSVVYDASDEVVARIEERFPGFLTPDCPMAILRDLRPLLYRALAPFLQDDHEEVRDAALLAAITLVEHPALAEHREILAAPARRFLDTTRDPITRDVVQEALRAWGHEVPSMDPTWLPSHDWGPHSDGRGDLVPPF